MSVTIPELVALITRVEKGDLKARLLLKEHLIALVKRVDELEEELQSRRFPPIQLKTPEGA